MKYSFRVNGRPIPQSRPRFSTAGGFIKTYDTQESKDYKWLVYLEAARAFRSNGSVLLQGPLKAEIIVSMSKPKSVPKKRTFPCTKPDLDNFVKIALDGIGLKGFKPVIFENDSQIVELKAKKIYGEDFLSVEISDEVEL